MLFIKGIYRSGYVPAALIKKITVLGLPLLLNETLWAMGQAALLQSYSVGGIATVSAMNITNTVSNTFAVLYMAVGSAIAILLGHMLGAGEIAKAKDSAKKMIAFSLFMGVCAGLLIMICAPFFPLLYNTTEEVRSLATALILVIGGATPIHSFMHSTYFVLQIGRAHV